MAQPSRSVSERIKTVKSSLDNAEQSFLDNKDIRGELDLMLAEAELQNLRRKKDVPWSWNRQLLAACAAVLLVLAGFGGWYVAKDHYRHLSVKAASAAAVPAAAQSGKAAQSKENHAAYQKNIVPAPQRQEQNQEFISKADMHKLVQSARVELSSSK